MHTKIRHICTMKRISFILLLLIFSASVSAQNAKAIIGFYNLENLFDTKDDPKKNDDDFTPKGSYAYTTAILKMKLQNIADVVSQMGVQDNSDGPAILGVAEVENRYVLEELVKQRKIRDRKYKIVHFESPDNRGIDVALLYQAKYFRVLSAKALTVNLGELGDTRPTRDILFVSGRLRGELIHVFVNHWPSRRGGESASAPKRNKGAAVCKKVIDSLIADDADVKYVVMGDMNDDPTNESVSKILGAEGKLKKLKPGGMYNPFMKLYKNGIGSNAWQDSWSLFDQIIVSESFFNKGKGGLKFSHNEVFNRSFLIQQSGRYKGYPKRSFSWGVWNDGYSDHFPTMVYLK